MTRRVVVKSDTFYPHVAVFSYFCLISFCGHGDGAEELRDGDPVRGRGERHGLRQDRPELGLPGRKPARGESEMSGKPGDRCERIRIFA